jgi:uncharacterized membrane protein
MSEEYEQFIKSKITEDSEATNIKTIETNKINYVKVVDISIPFLSVLLLVLKYTIAFFLVSLFIFFTVSVLSLLGVIGISSIF